MSFQQPPPSVGFIKTAELAGSLLLAYPKRYVEDMMGTDGKPFDGIDVEIHVLDGPKIGTIEHGVWTAKMIVGSLKNAVGGDPVLGRLGQGVAQPGKSAPWVLLEFTDADAANATAYVARRLQQPAAAAPPAAPAAPAYPAAPVAPAAPAPTAPAPTVAAPSADPNGPMDPAAYLAMPLEVRALLLQSAPHKVPAGYEPFDLGAWQAMPPEAQSAIRASTPHKVPAGY